MSKILRDVLESLIKKIQNDSKAKKIIQQSTQKALEILVPKLHETEDLKGFLKAFSFTDSNTTVNDAETTENQLLEFLYLCQTIYKLKLLFIPFERKRASTKHPISHLYDIAEQSCEVFFSAIKSELPNRIDAFNFIESLKQITDVYTLILPPEKQKGAIEFLKGSTATVTDLLFPLAPSPKKFLLGDFNILPFAKLHNDFFSTNPTLTYEHLNQIHIDLVKSLTQTNQSLPSENSQKIKTICRAYISLQPVTPEILSTWINFYSLIYNRFTLLNKEMFEAIYFYRYELSRNEKLQLAYYSLKFQKEKNIPDKRIFNFLFETLLELEKEKFEEPIFQDGEISVSVRNIINLLIEINDTETLITLPTEHLAPPPLLSRDNTSILLGDTSEQNVLEGFITEIKSLLNSTQIKDKKPVWISVHSTLLEQISKLEQKVIAFGYSQLLTYIQKLTSTQNSNTYVSTGEIEKNLFLFLHICQTFLYLLESIPNNQLTISLQTTIINCLSNLTAIHKATHENFDKFIFQFLQNKNIFSLSNFSPNVINELTQNNTDTLTLVRACFLSQKIEDKELVENTNGHIRELQSNSTDPQSIKQKHKTFLLQQIEHITNTTTNLQRSFFTFLFKKYLKILDKKDQALLLHFLKIKTKLSLEDFLKNLTDNNSHPLQLSNITETFEYIVALISLLATKVPKNIASGTHETFQIPIKKIAENTQKLVTSPDKIISDTHYVSARKLIKQICRFLLNLRPYTPETLMVLVEIYQHIFNRFIHLDNQVHDAIFANRYFLTPEATLVFLYFSFQCQKEKNEYREEVASFLEQFKSVLTNTEINIGNKKIDLNEVILLSQDCSVVYKDSLFVDSHISPTVPQISSSTSETIFDKPQEPLSQEKYLSTTKNLARLLKEFLKTEDGFFNNMCKLVKGMEENVANFPEASHQGCIKLKTSITEYKKFTVKLFDGLNLIEEENKTDDLINDNLILAINTERFTLLLDEQLNLTVFEKLIDKLNEFFIPENFKSYLDAFLKIKEIYELSDLTNYLSLETVRNFFNSKETYLKYNNPRETLPTGLGEQLIKPLQRFPRYKMLIDNLLDEYRKLFLNIPEENKQQAKEILNKLEALQSLIAITTDVSNDAKRTPVSKNILNFKRTSFYLTPTKSSSNLIASPSSPNTSSSEDTSDIELPPLTSIPPNSVLVMSEEFQEQVEKKVEVVIAPKPTPIGDSTTEQRQQALSDFFSLRPIPPKKPPSTQPKQPPTEPQCSIS